MPSPTYKLIAATTVGAGGTTVIEFTSIPSTYKDLVLKFSGRDNSATVVHNIQTTFNNSATGYANKQLYGDGSSAGSVNGASSTWVQGLFLNGASSTASTFTNCEMHILNYASSNAKSLFINYVVDNNGTTGGGSTILGSWSGTSPITSIKLTSIDGATTSQYSTAYLYGISNS